MEFYVNNYVDDKSSKVVTHQTLSFALKRFL